MALFKILRGPSTNLGNQPFKDGYCYFAADTGLFYIDYEENGVQKRIPLNSDGATGIIDQNTGMPLKLWHGSADEYEAIEEKDDNTIYILNDEVTGEVSAEEIGYNNSLSGLKSVNVQDAINEIAAISTTAQNDVNTHISNEDIHVSIEDKTDWNNKADSIQEKDGSIITINNSEHTPFQGLRLFGKTIQDGTPTPEAPVELESVGEGGNVAVTVCGKNLFSGWIPGRINSENGSFYEESASVRTDYIRIPKGANRIYISGLTAELNSFAAFYDHEKKYISRTGGIKQTSITTALPENTVWIALNVYSLESTDSIVDTAPKQTQIEIGSAKTEFEPYKPAQTLTISTPNGLPGIPVTSGGNYTDESGQQWICDEVDFGRGVYVQRVKTKVFDGTEDTWGASSTGISGVVRMSMLLPDLKETSPAIIGNIICSHYPTVSAYNTWDGIPGVCVQTINNRNNLFFLDRDIQTLAGWKSFLSEQYAAGTPVTIQYALATPIETPLSAEELDAYAALHTNYPNTTVFNDAGAGMEVKYYTPTTAVSMVHSPNDKDKVLTIDEHGCVVLTKPENLNIPIPDVSGQIETHNNDENSHPYILEQLANKEVLGSAQEVRNELNVHADNTTIHITNEERANWNNKTTEEYVNQQIGEHNVSSDSHNDIRGDISNLNDAFTTHVDNKENPHEVTIEQIGAEAEGSAATALEEAKQYTNEKIDAIVGEGAAESLDTIGEISNALKDNAGIIDVLNQAIGEKATKVDLTAHINNKENPHSVTKSQVGLGNVDNTSDANKPVSTAQAAAIDNVKKTAMSYVDEKFNSIPDWAKSTNKPTYTASEVGAVPTNRTVNNKPLTSNISLTASDVSAVPTSRTINNKALTGNISLSASDVNADATGTASNLINSHNTATNAHSDIRTLITNITNGTTTVGKATSAASCTGNAATATTATNAANATNATNIYSSASTSKAYILGTTTASSANHATVYNASVYTSGSVLYGAAWNDYAEYRETNESNIVPGNCVIENGDGTLKLSTKRLQPGGNIVSDTFGFAIGETEQCKTPLAVAGRALAYPYENRETYSPGDAVCSGPNGTISKMTREEIREWPDRIVGTVSEVPEYENWGTGNVAVNGRIWIKVK